MKTLTFFSFLFISLKSFSQFNNNIYWVNYPEKTKNIDVLGEINKEYYISYINSEKKISIRKYSKELKPLTDIVLNIPQIKKNETFYQRSEIVNQKIFHFVAEYNAKFKKIDLYVYVQTNSDKPDTEKFFLTEYSLAKLKLWGLSLNYFSNFDIEFSADKTKFFTQTTDFSSLQELTFPMDEKSISVYDVNDLSKRITSYPYLPQRRYYIDNDIKVANNGNLFKSDVFRLKNIKTKAVSERQYKIIKWSEDDKKRDYLSFKSESCPIKSLVYDSFQNDFFVTATQYDSINNKYRLFNNIYDINSLKLKDSINVEIEYRQIENEFKTGNILSINKDSKNNLLIVLERAERNNSKYVTHRNITIYSLNLSTKKIKIIAEIPINDSLQFTKHYKLFDITNLKTYFINDTLYVLFRDYTNNEKAMAYSDYSKNDSMSSNTSIYFLKINADEILSKQILLNETEEKRKLFYKLSIPVEPNKFLIEDSKNNQLGIITIK
ncbi:MAG: hypothetical protein QM535_11340 [Limnohabitans sp.]|nr:hypothetical protein [Limnohabitans sp.]